MILDLIRLWSGQDITNPPKEQPEPIVIAKDYLGYDDMLISKLVYECSDIPYRIALQFTITTDGNAVQQFVTNLPIATSTGEMTLKSIRIPQYEQYRKPGYHTMNIVIDAKKDWYAFKTTVATFKFTAQYKIVE